jgi:hypothetical protein
MSEYDDIPSTPLTTSTIIHIVPSTRPLPIHSIPFPHSLLPLPFQKSSPPDHVPHEDDNEGTTVSRY